MKQIGVILHNLGGPTSLEAIRPFLTNLFLDPEIIKIPLPWPLGKLFPRRLFAEFVARRRTPKVTPNYEMIGGKSPLVERTQEQAEALEAELNRRFGDQARFHVRLGMRYWHPFTKVAAEEFKQKGIDRVFLLPLYPQYSRTTTGSSFKEWRDLHRKQFGRRFRVKSVKDYFRHPRYIQAINERIDATIRDRYSDEERRELHILFSAHGTPMSDVREGDPYSQQIAATVAAVMEARGHDYPHHQSFQSRVGPVKWLEPYTQDMLAKLGGEGVRTLLVVPVAFVTDHIETLHELDIELRHVASESGITKYEVSYALNADRNIHCRAGGCHRAAICEGAGGGWWLVETIERHPFLLTTNYQPMSTLIIGGGISGAAALHWLASAGEDVRLIERNGSLGGVICSRRNQINALIETGTEQHAEEQPACRSVDQSSSDWRIRSLKQTGPQPTATSFATGNSSRCRTGTRAPFFAQTPSPPRQSSDCSANPSSPPPPMPMNQSPASSSDAWGARFSTMQSTRLSPASMPDAPNSYRCVTRFHCSTPSNKSTAASCAAQSTGVASAPANVADRQMAPAPGHG